MCLMHPRTGRPHLGQLLTHNKPSAPNPVPEAGRRRAVAHVRPVAIEDIVRDASGPDPMHVI